MPLPRIIVTGASGFVGRHLLDEIKETHRIFGLGRRSQRECGAPEPPEHLVDPDRHRRPRAARPRLRGDQDERRRRRPSPPRGPLRLHRRGAPEVLADQRRGPAQRPGAVARGSTLRRFIFASSVAACRFPPPGRRAHRDERAGRRAHLRGHQAHRRGDAARVLGALPHVHRAVCGAVLRLVRVPAAVHVPGDLAVPAVERPRPRRAGRVCDPLPPRPRRDFVPAHRSRKPDLPQDSEVCVASPDSSISHRELFEAATLFHRGHRASPILMPKLLSRARECGARDLLGRILGERPFERPWMARYIDLKMTVNASKTRQRLGWAPRPRLESLRRMPFLLENRKTDPLEWNRANRAAMKIVHVRPNLTHPPAARGARGGDPRCPHRAPPTAHGHLRLVHYEQIPATNTTGTTGSVLRSLMNSIRTREKAVFMSYCRDLAERRFAQGFRAEEVCYALTTLNEVCLKILSSDHAAPSLQLPTTTSPRPSSSASTRFRTSSSSLGVSQAHRRRHPPRPAVELPH